MNDLHPSELNHPVMMLGEASLFEIQQLAQEVLSWGTSNCWNHTTHDAKNGVKLDKCAVVGVVQEDEKFPVMYIAANDYNDEKDWSLRLAKFYAAANPQAILAMTNMIVDIQGELSAARGTSAAGAEVKEPTAVVPAKAVAPVAPAATPLMMVSITTMKESNGVTTYGALLHKADTKGMQATMDGYQFFTSKILGRVQYEADCMRYTMGMIAEEPDAMNYELELAA